MIKDISEKPRRNRIELDLTGPEGNAVFLILKAKELADTLQYTEEETNTLIATMKSSMYDDLIKVFDDAFGSHVTLYRDLGEGK